MEIVVRGKAMPDQIQQYMYGWEKLHRAVRELTLIDAPLLGRMQAACGHFLQLQGGEGHLPRDLDAEYHKIVYHVQSYDQMDEIDEVALHEIAEKVLDLYVESERRGY